VRVVEYVGDIAGDEPQLTVRMEQT
jgi:hypothetical protein